MIKKDMYQSTNKNMRGQFPGYSTWANNEVYDLYKMYKDFEAAKERKYMSEAEEGSDMEDFDVAEGYAAAKKMKNTSETEEGSDMEDFDVDEGYETAKKMKTIIKYEEESDMEEFDAVKGYEDAKRLQMGVVSEDADKSSSFRSADSQLEIEEESIHLIIPGSHIQMKDSGLELGEKVFLNPDGAYMYAKKFLEKYHIRRMGFGESTMWVFDGKNYEPISEDELEYLIYSLIDNEDKMREKSAKGLVKDIKYYVDLETRGSSIFGMGQKYTFAPKDFKKIYGKVVCDNGIFDVRTKKFTTEFTSDLPFYFRAHAKYIEDISDEDIKTPSFDKIICDACNNDMDSVTTIIDAFGTCLIPDRAKRVLVLGNASNSGKSILFGHFLETLLSGKRVSHVSLGDICKNFSLGNIEEKILISCLDCDMGVIPAAATGMIKRITGEDMISIRPIYKSQKDILVRFKVIFGTNGSFAPAQPDAGWENRIVALPFICEKTADEIDLTLSRKLDKEKDMILTKVLRNLTECVVGKEIKIRESALSKECKEAWCSPTSYFEEFIAERVQLTGEKRHNYKEEEIYDAYVTFFEKRKRLSKEKTLCSPMERKPFGHKLLENSSGKVYKGRVSVTERPDYEREYPNAVNRICGLLLLNGADSFDNSDNGNR